MTMNISVLLTCFNRRKKTVACLESLLGAFNAYNANNDSPISFEIFLTDDGSTDGTAEAVREIIPDERVLHILKGNGNLFWAGGMRFAWDAALKVSPRWDYYLLINDDTVMLPELFRDLLRTDQYCIQKYGKHGVYTGFIRDPETHKVSFGGSTSKLLKPESEPQECTVACANVMFFAQEVVDKIGTFDDRYVHSGCDYDYSRMATLAGIPVLTTYSFVGECENEHRKNRETEVNTAAMSFTQRKKYMYKPTTGRTDYLLYIKKFQPRHYPISKIAFLMELYLPHIYQILFGRRKGKLSKDYMENANV